MSYVNTRAIDKDGPEWNRCRAQNLALARKIEDAETKMTGSTWFRAEVFGDALKGVPKEKPEGRGQILKL
jgi:hypothetical protein